MTRAANFRLTAWGFCLGYLAIFGGMIAGLIPGIDRYRFWILALNGLSLIVGAALIFLATLTGFEEDAPALP